jgi:hypothetical protein
LISDGGDISHGQIPQGDMPFLPTGLLIARKVTISGQWDQTDLQFFHDHVSGGASFGFGPFSFGGHYESDEKRQTYQAKLTGNTITFTDPQILGIYCYVLQKSPDPLPTLTWPSGPVTLTDFPEFLPQNLQLRRGQLPIKNK